jgi:hypothetical protein
MKSEADDTLRNALRRFMEMKTLTVAGWAREAGLSEGTLRNFLAGKSDTLTHASLAALASAAKQPIWALLGEGPLANMPGNFIDIEFEVSASPKKGPMEKSTIYLPPDLRFPNVTRFGAIIRDRSAEQLYLPGSIVICVNCVEAGRELRTGDHVLMTEDHAFIDRDSRRALEFGPGGLLNVTFDLENRFATIRTVSISVATGKVWFTVPTGFDWLPEHITPCFSIESMDGLPNQTFSAGGLLVETRIRGLIVASYSLEPLAPHDNTIRA